MLRNFPLQHFAPLCPSCELNSQLESHGNTAPAPAHRIVHAGRARNLGRGLDSLRGQNCPMQLKTAITNWKRTASRKYVQPSCESRRSVNQAVKTGQSLWNSFERRVPHSGTPMWMLKRCIVESLKDGHIDVFVDLEVNERTSMFKKMDNTIVVARITK